MRYIKEIAAEPFKIGLFAWNGKYIVKVETAFYEQTYKLSEMDFLGTEADLDNIFNDSRLLKTIAERFTAMHQDFVGLLEAKDLV